MRLKFIFWMMMLAGAAAFAAQPTGCDTAAFARLARQHVFMVDKEGKCLDPAVEWNWSTNIPGFSVRNSLQQLKAGLDKWRTNAAASNSTQPPRVVVFVHGGMNPYAASKARLLDATLMNSLAASNCYPIFVVWNSGPFSAYGEHLLYIRQGEKKPLYIGVPTIPLVLVSDLARGVARLPVTLFGRFYSDVFTTELRRDSALARFFHDTRTARWENFESLINTKLPDSYHPPQPEGDARSSLERSVRLTEYIVTLPTKIATLPLLDGMGTEAWDIMLRRTRTMFEPTASYEIDRMVKKLNGDKIDYANKLKLVDRWLRPVANEENLTATNAQSGAMDFLSQQFAEWSNTNWPAANQSATNLVFEFYGHSMGTIVLNQLFRNKPDIQANRIGYLGAACSIEDFKTALFPYLASHTNAQFYSLSLHRVRERNEYPLAGLRVLFLRDLIVRGSLLNWIDDILAKPNTISDRTLGAWENLTRALPDLPENLRARTHFRGCDIEPSEPVRVDNVLSPLTSRMEPQVHGDFTKTIFWSTNFLWPADTNQMELRQQ